MKTRWISLGTLTIATLLCTNMNAQPWNQGLNTVLTPQLNTIGTTNLSTPALLPFIVATNSFNRIFVDGTTFSTRFFGGGSNSLVINTNTAGASCVQAFRSFLGLYGAPSCVPDGTAGTDIYQAGRNIFMQPPVDVTGYTGASNTGRVFIGEAPFIPTSPSGVPKLLVRGGGSVAAACGVGLPNPDNIGLVSEGTFGISPTTAAANKWLALGTRPSAQPGFNTYGFRTQWNNYAGDLAVQQRAVGTIKDISLTWQDGTTTAAPNSAGFNSNNGLLIQFRNGNIPSVTPSNDRFTVARYSITNGTGLVEINGNLSTGVFLSPSDMRLKKDIVTMNNTKDLINRLNPVTYDYRAEEFGEMGLPRYKQYGFIAQEMEKVLPTHVVDLNNGFKAVNYVMLIPILTKAMQENYATNDKTTEKMTALEQDLTQKMTALEQTVATLKNENQDLKSELERNGTLLNSGTSSDLKNQFFQNKPNPFNDVTTINFAFKNDASYKIIVTDLTGKKVKEFANLSGTGELQVTKSDLPSAGIYLYSLITANGEIVATKQMVFEK